MEYGKFFKQARLQSGRTQKDVAKELGIGQPNISDWENDVSRPEYENLVKLSQYYEVSIYDLLGVEERFRF